MDPRLSDLPGILGLPQADIDVIRTGGPAVTEDVLGELIVSNRVHGTTEILLRNHIGCGFTTFTDDEMNAKLSASTGDASSAPMRFFSYKDPEENTREQIRKVRSHPWIAKDVPVRGCIFDVDTGRLREVKVLEQEQSLSLLTCRTILASPKRVRSGSEWPCENNKSRAVQVRTWGTITASHLWVNRIPAQADSALAL
jgi:carbonic anhydrase